MNSIKRWFLCSTGNHTWTCLAEEGIPATKEQLEGGVEGFKDYAKMYCKCCGKESQISKNFRGGI